MYLKPSKGRRYLAIQHNYKMLFSGRRRSILYTQKPRQPMDLTLLTNSKMLLGFVPFWPN